MSGERLVPVKSFEELRAGMLVVIACDFGGCGRSHRGMLLSAQDKIALLPNGKMVSAVMWTLAPRVSCASPVHNGTLSVSAHTVSRRIVFRVEDGLTSSTQETAKTRRPARAR